MSEQPEVGVGVACVDVGAISSAEVVQALVTAPAGAALLAWLETVGRSDLAPLARATPNDVDEAVVGAAAGSVRAMPVDELLTTAVWAAERLAGPWTADAPSNLARALRLAPARRPLATAVVQRLGDLWAAPLTPDAQVWFTTDEDFEAHGAWAPLGSAREPAGAWLTATWQGLWTAAAPTDRLAQQLVDTWEMFHQPVTRWQLRPDPSARVLELTGPDDWAALATDHPLARRQRPNSSWEIPGLNQHASDIADLAVLPGQRAMRTTMRYFVEPDWDSVARDWDAVHLTWGGVLLSEGCVVDLGDGDVAMLRNWNSERTLWLNPVLTVADALPAVPLPDGYEQIPSPRPDGPERRARDRAWLTHRLGTSC